MSRPSLRSLVRVPGVFILAGTLFTSAGCDSEAAPPDGDSRARSAGPDASSVTVLADEGWIGWGEAPTDTGPWSLAIHSALLVDGSGHPARDGGLLVRDGRIVYIGPLDPDTLPAGAGAEVIDADGRVLAPGFIDAHAHGDPLETPGFSNFLAQGITSIVLGMDGGSPRAEALAGVMTSTEALGPWPNVSWLAGHGTLRIESGMGYAPSTAEGRERLAALVGQAMDDGALGLSHGLEYDAGLPADAEELARVGAEVAARDGIIVSHMRSEDADRVEDSIDELIEQGRASGARVHVSHLKVVLASDLAFADRILARMERARQEGIRVSADVYPYTASFTGLSILFPEWARPPASYEDAVATRRDDLADFLRNRVNSRNGPGATLFATGPYAGSTLAEAADAEERPWEDILIELGPSGARAAYFVMDDGMMTRFLMDPHTVVSSDGSPVMGHPRGYGSFARIIRRYVVEEEALPIEAAVRKMSGRTADLFGLSDPARVGVARGYLRPGAAADFVSFHPEEVRDVADFEEPHRLAEGMWGVWVGGVRVVTEGAAPRVDAGGGPGAVIRRVSDGARPVP